MLKLTRKQELQLIDLGLEKLLEKTLSTPKPVKVKKEKSHGGKWTPERRKKYSKMMKNVWKKKRLNIQK